MGNPHITATPLGGSIAPRFEIGLLVLASAGGLLSIPVNLKLELAAASIGWIDSLRRP